MVAAIEHSRNLRESNARIPGGQRPFIDQSPGLSLLSGSPKHR